MSFKIPKIKHLSRREHPIAKAVDPIVEIVNKGLVINSETVIADRLPDGRISLRLAPGVMRSIASAANAVPSVTQITNVAGSGYTAGDVLTALGGIFVAPFLLTIDGVDGTGIPTSWHWGGGYAYSTEPSNPVSFSGGTGSGAEFNLTWDF